MCIVAWSLKNNSAYSFYLCNVVWSFLDNTAQGFYLCNIVPPVSPAQEKHFTEKTLCSVVLRLQTTLHKKKSYSMLH